MIKIILFFILVFIQLFAGNVENVTQAHNRPPYMLDKNIVLAGEQNTTVTMRLNGKDPDGGDVYFVLTNANPMQGVQCSIKNANVLECSVGESVVGVADVCTIGGTLISYCKEGYISTVLYDGGLQYPSRIFPPAMSKKEYKIKFRINANNNLKLPGAVSNKTDARSFYYSQKSKWGDSEYGSALETSNPTEAIASKLNRFDPGYMQYAMDNVADLESMSTKSVSQNSDARAKLGKAGSHLDGVMLNEVKMLSVEYTPFNGQEELPKSCIIERGGVFMNQYYVCSSDPYYPDNIASATHFYAVSGLESVAYNNCSTNCFSQQTCQDNSSDAYHEFFKNISEITPADASLFGSRFNSNDSIVGFRIKKRLSSGTLVYSHEVYFDYPISGNRFKWPYDNGNAEQDNVISPKLSLSIGTLGSFKAYNDGDSYFVEPDRRYYIKYKYGTISYKTHQDDALFTMELIKHTSKFNCTLGGGPVDDFETMSECSDACRVTNECYSYSSLDKNGVENIRNYCKDMQINIGSSSMPLRVAVEQDKCTLTDEVVLDKNGDIEEYYIKDGIKKSSLRPEVGFSEDSSVLYKENAMDMATAFVDMLSNGESQHRFSEVLYNIGEDGQYIDFNGNRKTDNGDSYSNGIVLYGNSDSSRDIYLVTIVTPHMIKANRGKKINEEHVVYGSVIIRTDVESPIIATSSATTTDIYYKVLKADELNSYDMYYGNNFNEIHWSDIRVLKGHGTYNANKIDISPATGIDSDTWTSLSNITADKFARVIDPLYLEVQSSISILKDNTIKDTVKTTKLADNINIYKYPDSNIFVYTDTMQNLKNKTMKQIVSTVISSYASGDNKYHIWKFSDTDKVLKKITSDHYIGPQGNALSMYRQTFLPNDVTSFFMDSTKSREDKLYFSNMEDSIRIQMATDRNFRIIGASTNDSGGMQNTLADTQQKVSSITCPFGTSYNTAKKRCESTIVTQKTCTGSFQYNSNTRRCEKEAYCPPGSTYKPETGECLGGSVLIVGPGADDPTTSADDNIMAICDEGRLEASSRKCIEDYYYMPSSYCGFGWQRDDVTLLCKQNAIGGVCPLGSTYSIVRDICLQPPWYNNANVDYCPEGTSFCMADNVCISEPRCSNGGYYDKDSASCKKLVSNTAMSQNGYYFAYIKQPNSNYAYFLTPIGDGESYQCVQNQFICNETNSLFNSKDACEKICNVFNNISNIDSEPSYYSGTCSSIGTQDNPLTGTQFSTEEVCNEKCYLPSDNIIFPAIDVLLQFTGGTATDSYNNTIKRKLTNGSYMDYTRKISASASDINFGFNNDGILFKKLKKGEQIEITFRSQPDINSNSHYAGYGRWKDDEVDSTPLDVSKKITIGNKECYNLNAYYQNYKFKMHIDTDFDSNYDEHATIGDGFICKSNSPFTITQIISFDGKKISYNYIDMMSGSTASTVKLTSRNSGDCKLNTQTQDTAIVPYFSDILPPEALNGKTFGVFKNTPETTGKKLSDVVDIVFPASPKKFKLGLVKVDISKYLEQVNGFDPDVLSDEVNKNFNIPIPFWNGIYASDYFYAVMNDTGLGDKVVPGGKVFIGYGYSQNKDCREFTMIPPFMSNSVNIEVEEPIFGMFCPNGYTYDVGICRKEVTSSILVDKMKICRPWWKINRTYSCVGTDEQPQTSVADELSFGYPRWINACEESIGVYKKLTLDNDGNIIEK